MRTICDACESAVAILFCAADEAALCRSCDDKVHMCNKLASRHVRVGLADPSDVPRCDICENAPAFFYCEIDGSCLCLQCDMLVHVGGKRTHGRYLLYRQRVEFPSDKTVRGDEQGSQPTGPGELRVGHNQEPVPAGRDDVRKNRISSDPVTDSNKDVDGNMVMDYKMIDLNSRPQRINGQASNNQGMRALDDDNKEAAGVVPVGSFKSELKE